MSPGENWIVREERRGHERLHGKETESVDANAQRDRKGGEPCGAGRVTNGSYNEPGKKRPAWVEPCGGLKSGEETGGEREERLSGMSCGEGMRDCLCPAE